MHRELESVVWLLVQEACDAAAFEALIQQAVDSFKREPGFDPLVRLHTSDIGAVGVRVLAKALLQRGFKIEPFTDVCGYLQLRSRLSDHICSSLQEYLVNGGFATEEIQEDQLARDLGL
ncbi:hypothetical protein [Pseudomonas sp. H1h]|uniref:hypothetical protein n=1 Tax=Pseudomonas sp. H1h TaxID=1397280 RepID=UPI00046A5889|nr:hypothetical protein [Pseudomonas sp. H1h]